MRTIIRWCLTNRSVVILFSLILLVAGGVSLFQINQELLPSINLPSVFVLVSDQGAGPAQVDQDITQPLIKGLTGLPQEEHINTTSSQGFSQISVLFNLNSSLAEDQDAVNRALSQIVLPTNAGKPQVQTISFSSMPSMIYSLEAKDGNLVRITQEANQVIAPALNGASGAAQIKISGGAKSEITITLDPNRLASSKISIQQVQQALSAAQVDLPAGESPNGNKSLPVQVSGSLKSIDDLKALVVSGSSPAAAAASPVAYKETLAPPPGPPSPPQSLPSPPAPPTPQPLPGSSPQPSPAPSSHPSPAPQPAPQPAPKPAPKPPSHKSNPSSNSSSNGVIEQPISVNIDNTSESTPAAPETPPPTPPPGVRLDQVSTISQGAVPLNGISRTNGTPSLQIEVIKASNGNAINLSNDIQHRVSGLHLNSADNLVLVSDSAQDIRASLNDLILEGLLGALLAILVIFFFLRSLRATAVTAISLPSSVLVAILGTALWGFSLNVLTLAGLTVAVGRIVDDAIVVLENSYRHLQEGESPLEATLQGTTEVSSAVISSTLTTVAVFLPIGLAGGLISRFFLPFSVTVSISLLASLLVALTLIPVLISLFLRKRVQVQNGWGIRTVRSRSWRRIVLLSLPLGVGAGLGSRLFLPPRVTDFISPLAALVIISALIPALAALHLWRRRIYSRYQLQDDAGWLVRIYRAILGFFLARGWRKAVLLSFTLFLFIASLVTLLLIPKNFLDLGGVEELAGQVTFPPGTTAAEVSNQLQNFEKAAQADSAVKIVQVTVGSSDFLGYNGAANANSATLVIVLKNKDSSNQVSKRLRNKLNQLYGTHNVQLSGDQSSATNGFVATLSSSNQDALSKASTQIVAKLSQDSNLTNVRSDISAQKPELLISVDPPQATAHGFSPQVVAGTVSGALSTREAGTLGTSGSSLRVQMDPNALTPNQLPNLPLAPNVKLSEVANIHNNLTPATINRVDNVQQATVSADILNKDTQGTISQVQKQLSQLTLPSGVNLKSGTSNQALSNSFNQMFMAIGIAIAAVFLILVIFFRSLATPFIILMTMPLALMGSLAALFLSGQALGLPAMLGMLMVFGIVVSNAILLLDFTERNREENSLNAALILAGSVRLRPILMTALATIMALVPVATGVSTFGGGGLISQSLAIVVEGGLISSTLFSLLVIPVIYSIFRKRPRGHRSI